VELANKTKVLVPGSYVPHLIPALGSIKVEDTYNLLGHALRKAISVIARQQGRAEVADEMSASILATSSLKALDLNWDEPDERNLALGMVLDVLERVETQIQQQSQTMTIR